VKNWWIVAVLLLSLVAMLVPLPVQAISKTDAWNRYPIPEKGEAGGWVLTSDVTFEEAGVTAICVAFDGTIYAATEEISGSPLDGYNLFKSNDDGYTWKPLWEIPADDNPNGGADSRIIALILPRWEDVDTLYLATQYNIYKSTDGGEKFTAFSQLPSASGTLITSLDVTYDGGTHLILVGTRDAAPGNYGGVYFYDESERMPSWADLRVGSSDAGTKYDVLDIAFSPNFADNRQIVAVVTDESNTIVTTRVNISGWGVTIGDAIILGAASTIGSLAFPADYDSDASEDRYIQYVGLDAGAYSYMITGAEAPDESMAVPLFAPAPIYSLAVVGESINATVVAGLTNGSIIHGIGVAYATAYTPPSADPAANTVVALGSFYDRGYVVYAGTSGANGGFARSVDSGETFARTALICDDLQNIIDLAVSPEYAEDSTVYMITEGNSGNSILWRTTDGGTTWDAVLTSSQFITLPSGTSIAVSSFDKVAISPNFASDTTVFICESGVEPSIWRSTDNGFRFSPLRKETGTTGTIDSWAIVDNRTLLVGDSLGNFYKTTNKGTSWTAVATGIGDSIESMALSPDYDNDDTILIGGATTVYLSTDNGKTWQKPTTSATGLAGKVSVAFDPYYPSNSTIYAAGADGGGIRRLFVDRDGQWRRIDNINPSRPEDTPVISTLVVGADGDGLSTIYGTDSRPVVRRVVTTSGGTAAIGGMARSLDPTAPPLPIDESPLFELVNTDLPTSATMSGLWLAEDTASRRLWSYDSSVTPNVLYAYRDTLILSPELVLPPDGASSGRQATGEVSWHNINSASSYEIWYDIAPSFNQSPAQIYSETADVSIVPAGGLDSGMTYYWKVRSGESGGSTLIPGATITFGSPALSRFSETWSFTTALGEAQWSPMSAPTGVAPASGASSVPLRPNFAWNPADWATGYEFILARDSGFTDVVIAMTSDKALNTTVWVCDRDLDYSTTYFWKVRAISNTSYSEWAIGIFTTEALTSSPPAPPSPPPAPPPAQMPPATNPAYVWAIIGIVVALIISLLVLIVRT